MYYVKYQRASGDSRGCPSGNFLTKTAAEKWAELRAARNTHNHYAVHPLEDASPPPGGNIPWIPNKEWRLEGDLLIWERDTPTSNQWGEISP